MQSMSNMNFALLSIIDQHLVSDSLYSIKLIQASYLDSLNFWIIYGQQDFLYHQMKYVNSTCFSLHGYKYFRKLFNKYNNKKYFFLKFNLK